MLSLYLYSHKQYIIEFQACITHIQISFSLNRSSEANPMTVFLNISSMAYASVNSCVCYLIVYLKQFP